MTIPISMPDPAPHSVDLMLQPMVHVDDVPASIAFYEQLGGEVRQQSPDGDWALIELNGAELSLLGHPPNPEQNEGTVELNFAADEDLDHVQLVFEARGVRVVQAATDTGFGQQLQIESPDGLLIKINRFTSRLGAPKKR